MWRVVYGVGASFGAFLQASFVIAHPGKMLQHPMDLVGSNVAMLMTAYCIWQFKHNGQAIRKLRAAKKVGPGRSPTRTR